MPQALAPDDLLLGSSALFCELLLPERDPDARWQAFKAWGERVAARIPAAPRQARSPKAKLRIGYVSSNFTGHSSNALIMPLCEERVAEAFELYTYAAVRKPDAATDTFRRLSDVWHEVLDWSDERLAEQIRADGIDILVDLNNHTLDHRLLCFARRPAPLQITGLYELLQVETVDAGAVGAA